jgi:DNA-binding NtrC family response regulator
MPSPHITPEAIELMERYSWPGNIRELRNAIERAVLLQSDDEIGPGELPLEKLAAAALERVPPSTARDAPFAPPGSPRRKSGTIPPLSAIRDEMERKEKEVIAEALSRCAGNQTRAAEMLGVTRRQLLIRLDHFDLARPRKRRPTRR